MTPAMINLLALIRQYEGGPGLKGYGTPYGGTRIAKRDVSKMTLQQVIDYQTASIKAGSASSAMGGYQFIKKTLIATVQQMKLDVKRIWTPDLQDEMAIHLMRGRRLDAYMAGTITAEAFANQLAMEWASLPVVSPIKGKVVGRSYYAGDGLNASHHKPADILAAVRALRVAGAVPPAPPTVVPLPPAPPKPEAKSLFGRLIEWLWG